jgi:hypothetical protein
MDRLYLQDTGLEIRRFMEKGASSLLHLWIFAPPITQNPDYPACFGSLQGKKSPCGRFFGILSAKRNKLLVEKRIDTNLGRRQADWKAEYIPKNPLTGSRGSFRTINVAL